MPSLCSAADYGQRSKVVPNQGKQQQTQGNRRKNDLKDKKGTGQQIISAVSTESKQSQIKGCEIKNSMEKK